MPQAQILSPIGGVRVTIDAHGTVVAVTFVDDELAGGGEPGRAAEAARQVEEYFTRARRDFDLALAPEGSGFERRVWEEVARVPYGATTSYGEVARRLGDPGLSRAVGLANARNPIAIVIPCHRVVGADGDLVGYAGGLWRKRWLLAHESGQRPLWL